MDGDWGGAETFFAEGVAADVLGFQFDLAGCVGFTSLGVTADAGGLNLGFAPALFRGEFFGVTFEVVGVAAEAAATWAVSFR